MGSDKRKHQTNEKMETRNLEFLRSFLPKIDCFPLTTAIQLAGEVKLLEHFNFDTFNDSTKTQVSSQANAVLRCLKWLT